MTPSSSEPQAGGPEWEVESLAARAAWDFGNIFAALLAQSQQLSSGLELPESARGPSVNILTCVRRGAELSTKIGGLGRTCSLGSAPADLNYFLPGATAFMARQLAGTGTVQYQHPEGGTLWAMVDEEALRQALLFLALNARDAAPSGAEITLRLSPAASASSSCACGRNMACIALTDSRAGGLSGEQLASCNGHPVTCEFARGLDLGLTAARRIIMRHGGCMMAENIQPCGVRFYVCLPVAHTLVPVPIGASKAWAGSGMGPDAARSGEHLLVVDDEDTVRSVVLTALSLRGYKTTEAVNGCDALEKFRCASPPIDLVLLDLGLPDMDGWTVLEKMREIRPGVPALVLSGSTAEKKPARYARDPGVLFLGKPFAAGDLFREVRKGLGLGLAPQNKPPA